MNKVFANVFYILLLWAITLATMMMYENTTSTPPEQLRVRQHTATNCSCPQHTTTDDTKPKEIITEIDHVSSVLKPEPVPQETLVDTKTEQFDDPKTQEPSEPSFADKWEIQHPHAHGEVWECMKAKTCSTKRQCPSDPPAECLLTPIPAWQRTFKHISCCFKCCYEHWMKKTGAKDNMEMWASKCSLRYLPFRLPWPWDSIIPTQAIAVGIADIILGASSKKTKNEIVNTGFQNCNASLNLLEPPPQSGTCCAGGFPLSDDGKRPFKTGVFVVMGSNATLIVETLHAFAECYMGRIKHPFAFHQSNNKGYSPPTPFLPYLEKSTVGAASDWWGLHQQTMPSAAKYNAKLFSLGVSGHQDPAKIARALNGGEIVLPSKRKNWMYCPPAIRKSDRGNRLVIMKKFTTSLGAKCDSPETKPENWIPTLLQHSIVPSPNGVAKQNYREWEVMLAGSVPIVENNPHTREVYEGTPALVLDHWGSVTEKLLRDKLREIELNATKGYVRWDKVFQPYWLYHLTANSPARTGKPAEWPDPTGCNKQRAFPKYWAHGNWFQTGPQPDAAQFVKKWNKPGQIDPYLA
eukprot:TRINITY_DN69240_c0_g1_i1.p1 TRINITY_DN69240_c0_g1~~TRINITY_DN69240_c0_g1_i1.p1  ORF type:complete len:578 (+),score=26.72 TRINITY_DN69240_c0_g1_i1:25-1758(+)